MGSLHHAEFARGVVDGAGDPLQGPPCQDHDLSLVGAGRGLNAEDAEAQEGE